MVNEQIRMDLFTLYSYSSVVISPQSQYVPHSFCVVTGSFFHPYRMVFICCAPPNRRRKSGLLWWQWSSFKSFLTIPSHPSQRNIFLFNVRWLNFVLSKYVIYIYYRFQLFYCVYIDVQAYLRDIAGLVPDYHNKANIIISVSHMNFFQYI